MARNMLYAVLTAPMFHCSPAEGQLWIQHLLLLGVWPVSTSTPAPSPQARSHSADGHQPTVVMGQTGQAALV